MTPDGRPAVDAGLLGGVLERLPARLRRRLDAEPGLAEAWAWSVGDEVAVASPDATVVLRPEGGVVRDAAAATCSCLLAPACLHIAAVLVRLAPETGVSEPGEAAVPAGAEPGPSAAPTPDMLRAAGEMAAALARLLDAGATAAGVVAVGHVLRATHSCQAAGLHRAAGAGLRVARGLGRLRDDDPSFRLRELRIDLADGLTASRLVRSGDASRAAVGTARRAYDPVARLRLYGLFSEPVVSRSGYAGCATYLVDGNARIWVVSDVQPAPAERAPAAYGQAVGLGDVPLTHRQLARAGALVAEGTASASGRLGRGSEVRAVSAAGAAWWEAPIAALFDAPLDDQLARVWAEAAAPASERREGWPLVFLRATFAGPSDSLLELRVEGRRLLAGPAGENELLLDRENLGTLAESPGAEVLVVARPLPERPGQMELLAVGATEAPSLPESWGGRASLGLDRIPRGAIARGEPVAPAAARRRSPDVVDPISRRLDRLVLGGRATLGVGGRRGVDRDLHRLRARHLAAGADLLDALAAEAASRSGPDGLAERWLALEVYEATVGRQLGARRWLEG